MSIAEWLLLVSVAAIGGLTLAVFLMDGDE